MKKFLALLMALVFALFVAGCGGDNNQASSSSSSTSQTAEQQAEKQAKAENEATEKAEKEASYETEKQLKKIKSDTDVKDLMNGANTKAIGKYSVIEMTSSEFDSLKEVWYFKWAKDKVDKHEWNYAVVVFTDKQGYGASYNGVFQINCQLTKDRKDGSYSIGTGDIYVESDSDKGHLKKFE